MSTKTTRSGRSVKRPAKLISEDDGNEEPMSTLTTKKPIKPLTKKKEQVSHDYENPNELPNPVVKSSRRPLRNLRNSQKDKTAVEASKPSKTDRRLTKEINENSHTDEKPKDDVDKESESSFALNSLHKKDNNLAIRTSKTDDDSKEMPKKVAKTSRKPVKKEDEKSQLPINDRPRRQMKRKIPEDEASKPKETTVGTTKKRINNKALKTDEIAQMLNSDDEEVEVAPAKKRATTKRVQNQMITTSCTAKTVLKHGTEDSLKTDEIAQKLTQMFKSDDEEAKKRATNKKVPKHTVGTSCSAETVLKHGTEDSLKTDEIAKMLNDDEKEEVPVKKRATRKKVQKQTVEKLKKDKKDQDSEDKEVSFKEGLFNFSRAEDIKKKPIYMRNFSPDKKLKVKHDVFDDLYDMGNIASDSSQDDKNAKKKKKRRAPAKRKQKAGMILAFDSNKTQVANVVKKIMNVQSAKKVKEQPRRNLNLKVAETKNVAVPEKNNPQMLHEAVEISQPDIILSPPVPSTSRHLQESETSRILPASTSNLQVSPGIMNFDTGEDNNILSDIIPQIPEYDHQNSSNHNSAENNKKEYKTPVIQKNVSKLVQLRKASTPRLEEAPPKETKENMIKKCFGFDTDSSGCDSDTNISNIANTTRDSLAGFSPVKSMRPNNNLLITPAPYNKTCDKTTKVKPYSGPWIPPSLLPTVSQVVQPPPTTKPMRFAPRMQFKRPNPTSTNVSNSSRSRHFSKPTKKPTQISSSSVPEMEVSVFDDLKDEITQPDVEANTDTGRNQLEENPDTVDKQENKEIAEQPKKNAFEALKKPRNGKNEKHKPLKTVTNTRSTPAVTKTKQPKIYDESNGRKSLAGTKKIEMSNVATNEEQDFFNNVATNEEEDENGIRLQMKPVKSYTRGKPINTSITASPPKKMKKKEKEEKAWVSKNKSHFNDIGDFDLSFD